MIVRVETGQGEPVPLDVELAEDATTGELADHLAHVVGGSPGAAIAGFGRVDLVRDVGPPSGSVVRLVPCDGSPAAGRPSPASLVLSLLGTSPISDERPLVYGANHLDTCEVHVSDRVELRAEHGTRVLVNGEPVFGPRRVHDGDIVTVLENGTPPTAGAQRDPSSTRTSWNATSPRTLFMVRVNGMLDGSISGPSIGHRSSRRVHDEFIPPSIELPTPPDRARMPGLPIISAMVPLLLGAGLWMATRSLASAMFVVFSFVYVIAAGFEARREFRKDVRFAEASFETAAASTLAALSAANSGESAFLGRLCPQPEELDALVRSHSDRVWERQPDDTSGGMLMTRLGTAVQNGTTAPAPPTRGRSDLLGPFVTALLEARSVRLPLLVDIDDGGGLGLVSEDDSALACARWIVVQLCSLIGPDHLRLLTICSPEREEHWSWTAYLPHVGGSTRTNRTIVVVDGADDDEVLRSVDLAGDDSLRFVFIARRPADLPKTIHQLLDLRGAPRLVRARRDETIRFVDHPMSDVRLETIAPSVALEFSTRLAPLVPEHVLAPATAAIPRAIGLSGLMSGDDPLAPGSIAARWVDSSASPRLGAPVATAGSGTVSLDPTIDGPHALIAGMTGAGKSELLRTWLLSVALHHQPSKVTFLLVDYKGGSAFGPLEALPHTVGLITDLDGTLADRAAVSLRAELRRREAWLAARRAASMVEAGAITDRPPALMIAVDEFATLAKEIPHFVDELIDVAQRGRSLGIHLILATQRPHGVVSEAIRANTSLRVALRVADESDSLDVIDVPDAASISRAHPGTGMVRIGPTRSGVLRFGYSSGPFRPTARVTSRPLFSRHVVPVRPPGDEPSEIGVAVANARAAFESSGAREPRSPWMQPLGAHLTLASVPTPTSARILHVGLVDRPDRQSIDPLVIDLDASVGTVVYGAPGSGRSTALRTIGCAASEQSPGTTVFAIGGSVGTDAGSIGLTDHERVLRLLRSAARQCGEDRSDSPMVITVDDIALFEMVYEPINRGEAIRILELISREGSRGSVNLVVGASRRMDLPSPIAVGFGCEIVLRLTSTDEATLLGVPTGICSTIPPGRGFHRGNWIQLAQPTIPDGATPGGVDEQPVPTLPDRITLDQLSEPAWRMSPAGNEADAASTTGGWVIPVGLDSDDLRIAYLDLTHGHGLIAGPRRSGRSSALGSIAAAFRGQHPTTAAPFTLLTTPDHTTAATVGQGCWDHLVNGTVDLGPAITAVQGALGDGRPVLVALDDVPNLLDGPDSAVVEQYLNDLLALSLQHPLRLLLAGEIDAISRCYSAAVMQVRSGRTGVLLRPDIDIHGAILACELGRRDELRPAPGRGWLVNGGECGPVQLATSI